MKRIEIKIGDKFGEWTVTGEYIPTGAKAKYPCKCSCGFTQEIVGTDLRSGKSRSCRGCNLRDRWDEREENIETFFWKNVKKGPRCWEWLASKVHGYGCFSFHKKQGRAHRFSWELENGPIPKGLHVCHKCDNRGCVRPEHLFLGTNEDNQNDKIAKGRQGRGEGNGRNKLSEKQVIKLRKMKPQGYTNRELAKIFHISPTVVSYIVNRKMWKHI